MQSVDRAAVVVVAHPALETSVRAGARIVHRLAQRFDRERFRRQRETRHAGGAQPPLTGGTNTISLPSTSASSQCANVSSPAPRSQSTGGAKPWRSRSHSYSARKSAAPESNVSLAVPADSRRLATHRPITRPLPPPPKPQTH